MTVAGPGRKLCRYHDPDLRTATIARNTMALRRNASAPQKLSGKPRHPDCGIRRKADRIPREGGQHSDECGQPMMAG